MIFDSVQSLMKSSWTHIDKLTPCSSKTFRDGTPSMNISCRNGLAAWIAYLTTLTTRAAFEEEVGKRTYFEKKIRTNCSPANDSHCRWLESLAGLCKDRLQVADKIRFVPNFLDVAGEAVEPW